MTWLSPYWLLILNIVLAGIWLAYWITAPSARHRQWLSVATLCAIPVAIGSFAMWSWSIGRVSLLGEFAVVEASISLCLALAVCAIASRRLVGVPFPSKIDIRWSRYGLALVLLVTSVVLADAVKVPREYVLVVVLIGLGSFGLFRFRTLRHLSWTALSAAIGLLVSGVAGAVAEMVTGYSSGAHLGPLALGFSWQQLGLLVLLAATWPILINMTSEDSPAAARA
jgi:hypothetical protein